jgi:hypothetical protein
MMGSAFLDGHRAKLCAPNRLWRVPPSVLPIESRHGVWTVALACDGCIGNQRLSATKIQAIAWVSGRLNRIVKGLLRPSFTSNLIESVIDLSRSKADLIAENALLRHQLTLLKRQSERLRGSRRRRSRRSGGYGRRIHCRARNASVASC